MSVKTLIFGARSNLSIQLHKEIKNSLTISTADFLGNEQFLENYKDEELNIIVNTFYPALKLNSFEEPVEYIKNTVFVLARILEQIKVYNLKINKIIYTSSASVYGNNNYCAEVDTIMPLSIHASLKISSEKLLEGFCKENNINYTISRVFNMYGGNDNFSIISKIINSVKHNKTISLINNGTAIRDFIHIDDVVNCYKNILLTKEYPIINIASGEGVSIKMILDNLKLKGYTINIINTLRDEIKISTANVTILKKLVGVSDFKKVIDFIEDDLVRLSK